MTATVVGEVLKISRPGPFAGSSMSSMLSVSNDLIRKYLDTEHSDGTDEPEKCIAECVKRRPPMFPALTFLSDSKPVERHNLDSGNDYRITRR